MNSTDTNDCVDGRHVTVDYLFNGDFTPATKDEIRAAVLASKKLEYSWSIATSGVYHTAVVIYLDGAIRYTVNWGPKSETYTFQLVGDVEGEVSYGVEDSFRPMTEYKDALGEVDIIETVNENAIDSLLENLLTFDEEYYNMVHCNCRDHVVRVMKRLGVGGEDMARLKDDIESIRFRLEDILRRTT